MSRTAAKLTLPALLSAIAAWMAFRNSAVGDFRVDAAPALTALTHGHVGTYLSSSAFMGPVATIFEAPFYLIGGSEAGSYHWVCFGCLLALVALACHLREAARARGLGGAASAVLAFLIVLNPVTFEAIQYGHPEELLTAALVVTAVALAVERRPTPAAICLGLALATKQWAIIAIFPVLMALPMGRIRAGLIAGGVLVAAYLPSLLAAPGVFLNVQGYAAAGVHRAGIWSIWFPVSPPTPRTLPDIDATTVVHVEPALIQPLTHILIVGLIFAIPLAIWAWRRQFTLDGARPFALLALLAMVRCSFDPVDNLYYHAPLLLTLIAWDAYDPGRLPLRGLAGVAVAYLFRRWSFDLGDLNTFNMAYLGTMLLAAGLIAAQLRSETSRRGERPRLRRGAAANSREATRATPSPLH